MHVLVTWTSLEGVAKRLGKAIDPPKEFMEPEWNEDIKPRGKLYEKSIENTLIQNKV